MINLNKVEKFVNSIGEISKDKSLNPFFISYILITPLIFMTLAAVFEETDDILYKYRYIVLYAAVIVHSILTVLLLEMVRIESSLKISGEILKLLKSNQEHLENHIAEYDEFDSRFKEIEKALQITPPSSKKEEDK